MERNQIQNDMIDELTQRLPLLRASYSLSQTQLGALIGKSRQ